MKPIHFIFAGYFPKRTARPASWSGPEHVREILSVSECLLPGPQNWVDFWLHNQLGFFDTPRLALQVCPPAGLDYSLLAFHVLDHRFAAGDVEDAGLPGVNAQAPGDPCSSLGFDVVSKSLADFFECSPLSCNLMANEHPVNPYCLLETLPEAIRVAEQFSREEPEPGPYYVFQVSRLGAGDDPAAERASLGFMA